MKTEKSTALDLANAKLVSARDAAKAHLAEIKAARQKMEREGFTYLPTDGVAEVARLGVEFENKKRALRNSEINSNLETSTLDQIDKDVASAKALLEGAFEFLRGRHRDFMRASKPGFLSKLSDALKPAQDAQDWPAKREEPRGQWGAVELVPVEVELDAIGKEISLYPNGKSFPAIISLMHTVNGRLELPAVKAKEPEPFRAKYTVKEYVSPPQPRTPYTPLTIGQTNRLDPSQPMRAERLIIGA